MVYLDMIGSMVYLDMIGYGYMAYLDVINHYTRLTYSCNLDIGNGRHFVGFCFINYEVFSVPSI